MKFTALLIVALLVVSCIIGPAYADNTARVQLLLAQQQKIIQDIQKLQGAIEQKKGEVLKIQGAIEELQRQDDPLGEKAESAKKKK